MGVLAGTFKLPKNLGNIFEANQQIIKNLNIKMFCDPADHARGNFCFDNNGIGGELFILGHHLEFKAG